MVISQWLIDECDWKCFFFVLSQCRDLWIFNAVDERWIWYAISLGFCGFGIYGKMYASMSPHDEMIFRVNNTRVDLNYFQSVITWIRNFQKFTLRVRKQLIINKQYWLWCWELRPDAVLSKTEFQNFVSFRNKLSIH